VQKDNFLARNETPTTYKNAEDAEEKTELKPGEQFLDWPE
jgi:hypothetical protein